MSQETGHKPADPKPMTTAEDDATCNRSFLDRAKAVATSTPVKVVAAGTVGTVATITGASLGLSAFGFGAAGVAAGSMAAAAQSTIGNVVAGSWFASLQTLGAVGVGLKTGLSGAAAGVGGYVGARRWWRGGQEEGQQCDTSDNVAQENAAENRSKL